MAYILVINDKLYVHRSPFRPYGGNFNVTSNIYDAMRFTRKGDAEYKVHVARSVIDSYLDSMKEVGQPQGYYYIGKEKVQRFKEDWYINKRTKLLALGFDVTKPYTIEIKEVE